MIQLALANLKAYSRRFIAVILAVMIGTAFLAATLMVNASATESLKNSIGSAYASADLVVTGDMNAAYDNDEDAKSESYSLGSKALEAIGKTPGVAAVHGISNAGASVQAGSKRYYAQVSTPAADAQLNTTTLESGAMPVQRRPGRGGCRVRQGIQHLGRRHHRAFRRIRERQGPARRWSAASPQPPTTP